MSETAPITCFACDREPTQQCSRCGRPYCDEHGEEQCDVCLHPSTGVPSFSLYRGSLLALLIGTALAVWLLVQPTGGEESQLRPVVFTPTSAGAAGQASPGPTQPAGNTTPGTAQPQTTTTPPTGATATATARPSTGEYTVVSGDTLSGICSRERPLIPVTECVERLRSLNNISGDTLEIGQRLRLP